MNKKISSILKNKIRKNKLTIGSWITLAHLSIPEIMAEAGFDWLVVDMEHSAIMLDQAQGLIQAIEASGVVPLVRVSENNQTLIKRVMDAGAYGVIVPMVNNKESAIRAVNAVKYPPLGERGVGLARAQGYGLKFQEYREWVNKESIVIVQIEHIEAVRNLEEILTVDGIDGFIVGPYDLSASLGRPGDFNHRDVRLAFKTILKAAKLKGKTAGFHVIEPNKGELLKKVLQGYRFLGFSLDTLFLGRSCLREVGGFKAGLRNKR